MTPISGDGVVTTVNQFLGLLLVIISIIFFVASIWIANRFMKEEE